MPLPQLNRFADLKAKKYVDSREQLKNLQTYYGFPKGKLISPNIRVWTDEEIEAWFESRPTEVRVPLRGAAAEQRRAKELGEPAPYRRRAKARTEEAAA
jgi:hypothetical protein